MKIYTPPPDKAITHRALMLAAVADGNTRVCGPSLCEDTLATAACLKKLGVSISASKNRLLVKGLGLGGLKKPRGPLNAGASGTTMRLLAGLLAGQDFDSTITGKGSLLKRPAARVAAPLVLMGAKIRMRGDRAPIHLSGSSLKGINHKLAVPSAQVKSAILLAGLYAAGPTSITERFQTRDHTERLLKHLNARISAAGLNIYLKPGRLKAKDICVPGDISSAAPFIAAACLLKGFKLTVKNVGLNPGRTGLIRILKAMGAKISVSRTHCAPEPAGNITVSSSPLNGIRIRPDEVPAMVDELPLLALSAARASGTTVINGIGELKHKESDRLRATLTLFKSLGLMAKADKDSLVIKGPQTIAGGRAVDTFNDHRIAMTAAVGALLASKPVKIRNPGCVKKSYPAFFKDFNKIFPRQ
ncbi:MAG: 3-phosphoshikimate 1-carboxyvinyltransferase [Elusimicrobia bacterium]|nr:3-phosphoshikimate 1-carboxyvinyltransferase [Elusimicrobiota bacterium]